MAPIRDALGEFSVTWRGEPTGYRIINGSLGLSGRNTQNMYGIVKPNGEHKWIGSLAGCKKSPRPHLHETGASLMTDPFARIEAREKIEQLGTTPEKYGLEPLPTL